MAAVTLIALLIFVPYNKIQAQDSAPVFGNATLSIYDSHYKQLPQNSIISMIFDKWGFLWLATPSGLARFDGHNFKNYGNLFQNKQIMGFIKVSEDTIFAFCHEGKADYNIINATVPIITGGTVTKSVAGDSIMRIHGYPLFNSFCFAPIFKKNGPDFAAQLNFFEGIANHTGFNYAKDTFALTYPINHTNSPIYFYKKDRLVSSFPIQNLPINLAENVGADNIQTAKLNHSILSLDSANNFLVFYNSKGKLKNVLLPFKSKYRWVLFASNNDRYFFLRNNRILYQVSQNDTTGDIVYTKMMDDFVNLGITMIINRDNNTLIVATATKGLFVYKKNKLTDYKDSTKINNCYYAQSLLQGNTTVLTGRNSLFNKNGFMKKDPRLSNYPDRAIFKDSENNYWYSATDFDSATSSPKSKIFKSKDLLAHNGEVMSENKAEIFQYLEDSKKRVWTISENDFGYFEAGSTMYKDILAELLQHGIEYPSMLYLTAAEDKTGKFLLGGNKGIYIFNPDRPLDGFTPYALAGVEVRYINVDKQTGRIWVCTKGKGMCSIKDDGKSIVYFPPDKNEAMNTVHYFITDKRGMTWISTNNGLFVTSEQSLLAYNNNTTAAPFYFQISKSSGLSSNEFNGACQSPMLLLPDNSLSVSSMDGLVWANTNDFTSPFPQTPAFLESTIAGNTQILDNNSQLYFKQTQKTSLSFTLSYADWNDPDNIEIAYNFEEEKQDSASQWQPINNDNKITFSYLPAGKYFLTVRKRTGFGLNDYQYTKVTITVMPLWYETKWFFAVLWVLGLLLITFIGHTRNRLLKSANKRLNIKIDDATKELAQKNLELTHYNKTKDKLLSLFGHDVSVPMFYVNQVLSQIVSGKDFYEVPPALHETLTAMVNTTSDLNEIMDDLLYWIKLQQDNVNLSVNKEPVNVKASIDSILHLFRLRVASGKISVTCEVDEDFTIPTDERLFTSILQNVLSNAIKFTHNGYVNINLVSSNAGKNTFSLVIKNSVATPEELGINSNTKNTPKGNNLQSRGIGLMLVEDFANLLGLTVNFAFGDQQTFCLIIDGLTEYSDDQIHSWE